MTAARALAATLAMSIAAVAASWLALLLAPAVRPSPVVAEFLPWCVAFLRPEPGEKLIFHLAFLAAVAAGIGTTRALGRRADGAGPGRLLAPAAVAAAGAGVVFAFFAAWLRRGDGSPPIIAGALGSCVAVGAGAIGLRGIAGSLVIEPALEEPAPGTPRLGWRDVLVVAALFALFHVRDPQADAASILASDGNHHWNHFMVSPGLQVLAGRTPGLDFESQYGAGVPLAWKIARRAGLDGSIASILPWVGVAVVAYYFVVWRALLRLGVGAGFALAGVAAAAAINWMAEPRHECPSSTILRRPLDALVLLTLLSAHASSRERLDWLRIAGALALAGLSLFWETDTGIVIAGATGAALSFAFTPVVRDRVRLTVAGALGPALVFFATSVIAFGVAAASLAYVRGLLGPPLLYGGLSFGAMPMTWHEYGLPANVLRNVVTPAAYALAVALALGRPPRERTALDLAVLFAGVLGWGLYQNYLGRSHTLNWHHGATPFVLLATVALARSARGSRAEHVWPLALAAPVFLVGVYLNRPPSAQPAAAPLAEEHEAARVLREVTRSTDRIFCLGLLGPQLLALSERAPSHPPLPLLELVRTKAELARLLSDVDRSPPTIVVYDKRLAAHPLDQEVARPVLRRLGEAYELSNTVGPYAIIRRK